jgi:hypothetical protein
MPAGKVWGFGIVGVGMGAFTHAANFLEMENASGVACYGRAIEKAEAFKDKWQIKRASGRLTQGVLGVPRDPLARPRGPPWTLLRARCRREGACSSAQDPLLDCEDPRVLTELSPQASIRRLRRLPG